MNEKKLQEIAETIARLSENEKLALMDIITGMKLAHRKEK